MSIERIHRVYHSIYYALNCYIQEVQKPAYSNRGVKVETREAVGAKDLPKHLGNRIDLYI